MAMNQRGLGVVRQRSWLIRDRFQSSQSPCGQGTAATLLSPRDSEDSGPPGPGRCGFSADVLLRGTVLRTGRHSLETAELRTRRNQPHRDKHRSHSLLSGHVFTWVLTLMASALSRGFWRKYLVPPQKQERLAAFTFWTPMRSQLSPRRPGGKPRASCTWNRLETRPAHCSRCLPLCRVLLVSLIYVSFFLFITHLINHLNVL